MLCTQDAGCSRKDTGYFVLCTMINMFNQCCGHRMLDVTPEENQDTLYFVLWLIYLISVVYTGCWMLHPWTRSLALKAKVIYLLSSPNKLADGVKHVINNVGPFQPKTSDKIFCSKNMYKTITDGSQLKVKHFWTHRHTEWAKKQ